MTKQECLDYLGITKWHEHGYRGEGIKIMSDELISKNFKSIHTNKLSSVICPVGYSSQKSCHGKDVMVHILMVAPEATCISFPFGGIFSTDSYTCECAEYIKENNVDIFTTSCSGQYPTQGKQKAIQDCIENGCIFFGAAGNDNAKGVKAEIRYDGYWAIGGVKLVNGVWQKVGYSSVGEELDFVCIAEILDVIGTSFCAPVFAAMCGLVQQFFKQKAGRKLTRAEMKNFIADNLIDVHEEGFDTYTGHGLFILPDPDSIDVYKYVSDIDVGYPNENIYYGGFPEVRSDMEMRGIDKLHPELQLCVEKFLAECTKQNLNVLITETLRTQEEQEALYAQGRTKSGKIVTNCRGYQSPHCWGVAFDFCRNVKGREYDNTDGFFNKVGEIAKTIFDGSEYDLFWGGDFKTFVDKPHIEMIKYLPFNSTKQLIKDYGTPEEFMKTWKGIDDIMLENIALVLGISKEQLATALIDVLKHVVHKNEKPKWLTDDLYARIEEKDISDMTRPNDLATRAEVMTMIYNAVEEAKQ